VLAHLVLLTTAGLFVRAVAAGASIDPGFDGRRVALATFNPGSFGYDEARGRAFYVRPSRGARGRAPAPPVRLAGRSFRVPVR
jgi:hypothetical protein